jgi:hypothetical protein
MEQSIGDISANAQAEGQFRATVMVLVPPQENYQAL